MKRYLLKYFYAWIFILCLIIERTESLGDIIPLYITRPLLLVCGIIIIVKISLWVYSKLFYKVRNRILGIFLFTGLIPIFFLIILFMIIFYIFIMQAVSLDLDYAMLQEISALKELSLDINALFLQKDKLDHDSLNGYIETNKGYFDNLILTVYNDDMAVKYHYGKQSVPFPESRGLEEYTYFIYDERPFLVLVFDRNISGVYKYNYLAAVPLEKPYIDNLSDRLGGQIFFSYIGFDEEVLEEDDRNVDIKISRDDKGEIAIKTPEGVDISFLNSQKEGYREWKKSLNSGWKYFKTALYKRSVVIDESGKVKDAMVLGIFQANFGAVIDKYLKGTISYFIPKNTIVIIIAIIAGMVLAALMVSLIISLFFSVSITSIISQLHKKAKRIAKGNFPPPINSRRKDQLGELTRTFDKMSFEIQELLSKVKENEKLENEISIAQMVQNTFFPKKFPDIKGAEIYGKCIPARMVSGDFYDFSPQHDDMFDLCIGDISGKGISASLLMASSLTFLRMESLKRPIQDIDRILDSFNTYLYEYSARNQFCSLIYSRIYTESLKMEYINAGHPSPIIIRGENALPLESNNLVAGVFKDQKYERVMLELQKGDIVFMFTDGFVEIMTNKGYRYSYDDLVREIIPLRKEPLELIYERLILWVKDLSSENSISDDMTAVLIRI